MLPPQRELAFAVEDLEIRAMSAAETVRITARRVTQVSKHAALLLELFYSDLPVGNVRIRYRRWQRSFLSLTAYQQERTRTRVRRAGNSGGRAARRGPSSRAGTEHLLKTIGSVRRGTERNI